MSRDDSLAQKAAAVRDSAEQELEALAGGASLCSIARSGASFPGGKYQEGRAHAAALVLRELARGRTEEEVSAATRERWAATAPASRRGSPDWRAYGEGGDDALADLLDGSNEHR